MYACCCFFSSFLLESLIDSLEERKDLDIDTKEVDRLLSEMEREFTLFEIEFNELEIAQFPKNTKMDKTSISLNFIVPSSFCINNFFCIKVKFLKKKLFPMSKFF
jgi:hypothetical protein